MHTRMIKLSYAKQNTCKCMSCLTSVKLSQVKDYVQSVCKLTNSFITATTTGIIMAVIITMMTSNVIAITGPPSAPITSVYKKRL